LQVCDYSYAGGVGKRIAVQEWHWAITSDLIPKVAKSTKQLTALLKW
jgi:hypothetical protein